MVSFVSSVTVISAPFNTNTSGRIVNSVVNNTIGIVSNVSCK